MLVLTRSLADSLQIGADVKVTVLRIRGNQVRLGIEAPTDIKIMRTKLADKEKAAPAPPRKVAC